MDDLDVAREDGFDEDSTSLADRFFYYTMILAVAMIIEHQGLYAPGL